MTSARLVVLQCPKGLNHLAPDTSFMLDAQRSWVFGSDPLSADIILNGTFCNERHAELQWAMEGGRVVWDLIDGGGENGTFLNGIRVSRARVHR